MNGGAFIRDNTIILEFYYMANGLTFEILNIIFRIFHPC